MLWVYVGKRSRRSTGWPQLSLHCVQVSLSIADKERGISLISFDIDSSSSRASESNSGLRVRNGTPDVPLDHRYAA